MQKSTSTKERGYGIVSSFHCIHVFGMSYEIYLEVDTCGRSGNA